MFYLERDVQLTLVRTEKLIKMQGWHHSRGRFIRPKLRLVQLVSYRAHLYFSIGTLMATVIECFP